MASATKPTAIIAIPPYDTFNPSHRQLRYRRLYFSAYNGILAIYGEVDVELRNRIEVVLTSGKPGFPMA